MRQLLLMGLVLVSNIAFAQIKTSEVSIEATGEITSIAGKVGIGTDAAESELHIRDNTARLILENTNAAETGWAMLRIHGTGTNFWDRAVRRSGISAVSSKKQENRASRKRDNRIKEQIGEPGTCYLWLA